VTKISVFWDIMPYSPLKIHQYFGGKCSLHLQDRRIIQVLLDTCFMLVPFLTYNFIQKIGGAMLLQNMDFIPEDRTLQDQKHVL
jgi:hypothetical protein